MLRRNGSSANQWGLDCGEPGLNFHIPTPIPIIAMENTVSSFNRRKALAARAPAILPRQLTKVMKSIARIAITFSCQAGSMP